jgi:probable HAF family extracellular repeat protein
MRYFSRLPSLGVCFAILITQAALTQTYTVLDLGALPRGSYSTATGINASGQVVGSSDIGTRDSHAFLFSNGTMQDLGTLGGKASRGIAINAAGQVLGWSYINDTITVHPFLFSGGRMQDLGIAGTARAFNDFGQVTGHFGSPEHAFLFSNGTMYDLGTPPGFTSTTGYGINNSGQVTGEAYFRIAYYHAFLYSNGTMQDLGALPGGNSSGGRAINNSGQVTGTSAVYGGYYHAFIYSNGTMQDLGTLPGGQYSAASAINNYGHVTGYAVRSTGSSDARAFLYSNGTMQDLNDLILPTSGWTLSVGTGINDAGQITGDGILDGRQHAFLLTRCPHEGCPVVPDVTPPWITLFATPKVLRPHNGQMVPVTIWGTITDHESGVSARSVEYAVKDDYQQVQPNGPITLDPAGNYFFTILLPASHESDDLNGRRYTIRVNARDSAGNRAAQWQAVTVR